MGGTRNANPFERVEPKAGVKPSGRLVEPVMTSEPYASTRTVFWIVDNGNSHAGKASIQRLEGACAPASTTDRSPDRFEWTFTRTHLDRLLSRIETHKPRAELA